MGVKKTGPRSKMAKRKIKKKKLPTITKLRKRLDAEFNAYIRERDGKCILSGGTTDLSCSHYYDKKASPNLRWDTRNAHAMTKSTHFVHHHGKAPHYALWMFKKYGMAFMKQLAIDADKSVVYTRDDYNNKIALYKQLRKNLCEK